MSSVKLFWFGLLFLDESERKKVIHRPKINSVTSSSHFASHRGMPYQADLFYIEETKKGDLSAFVILIQKHEKYAFTLALRILNNQEEPKEVAQDPFMKAYHGIHSFEGNSKFTTWLNKIIFNEAIGRQRKNKIYWDSIENEISKTVISEDLLGGIERLQLQERKELIRKG